MARGRRRGLIADRQQCQHARAICEVDALQLRTLHALDAERGAAAGEGILAALALAQRAHPVETVGEGHEAAVAWHVGEIGHDHHRVLQMRRQHRKILGIESYELQVGHGHVSRQPAGVYRRREP